MKGARRKLEEVGREIVEEKVSEASMLEEWKMSKLGEKG